MKKKNVLVIILTALIFLSAVVLGVSTVYRVDAVSVDASVVSEEAKTEAAELQTRLTEAYKKQSVFFTDRQEADEIVADFPYFRITAFSRDYPNRLIVSVTEDAEVYAVPTDETAQTYYILNTEGTVLGIRNDASNRSEKMENILVKGLTATGEKGEKIVGDECLETLFSFLDKATEKLEGKISRNVVSVEIIRRASAAEETVFKLSMREGVAVYVRNPAANTLEKVKKALDKYLSLSSAQRLTGRIAVADGENGVLVGYAERDEFANI